MQYITHSLDTNSSNRMFSSIHDLSKTFSESMTLLIKIYRALATFSLTLMLREGIFLYSCGGELIQIWINPPQQEHGQK